ncbi:MAG: hypothetical protein JSV26_02645 [bacterium]|nr:MAG: hypothetical protein JSV26_02645 [bacterium]
MLIWLIIAIVLGFLGILEYLLGFSVPYPLLRTIMVFLIVVGMAYRIYFMEKDAEKERLKERVRELEDRVREFEMGMPQAKAESGEKDL